MEASTITPAEEQAEKDELERARARRDELAQKAQERQGAQDDGFHDPAAESPGGGADGASPVEPAAEGEVDGEQFVLVVGGKAPTQHLVTIMGGQVGVDNVPEGGFVKGESYTLRVTVKCRGHLVDDAEDGKTGQVIDTKKVDRLKIQSARVSR